MDLKLKRLGPTLQSLKQICLVVLKNTNNHAIIFRSLPELEPSWLMEQSPGVYVEQPASTFDKSLIMISVDESGKVIIPFATKDASLVVDSEGNPAILTRLQNTDARLDVVYIQFGDNKAETLVTLYGTSFEGIRVSENMILDFSWIPQSLFR